LTTTGVHTVKKFILLLTAMGACGYASAVDFGRVLSATPVVQQVAVPRQVCNDQQVAVQQPKTGAGAAIGAIAGGALGSASGGRGPAGAAATIVGALGGSILGDSMEGSPEPELRTVRQCGTQTTYENRTVAYDVVYEYAGKQYSVQMPNDPGPKLALQIGPADANYDTPSVPPLAAAPPVAPAPPVVYTQPPVVVAAQPVYPVYYPRPYYYPPIAVGIGLGFWGRGYGYWGHRHWR
jgi:uncharacterized protein YcfJ